MRNLLAAVLMGGLIVSPTLVLAVSSLPKGRPAGVKKAQVIESPIFAIALGGAIGLGVALASADDGVTPVSPPATTPSTT